jgi:hypothetical protein
MNKETACNEIANDPPRRAFAVNHHMLGSRSSGSEATPRQILEIPNPVLLDKAGWKTASAVAAQRLL